MKKIETRFLLLALLVLVPLAADFPVLHAGFAFDDLHSISRNPHIRSLGDIPRFFWDPTCFSAIPRNAMYRPFLLVTYAADYALAGLKPWFWHLTNLLLHGGAGLLVFFLLLRFLGRGTLGRSSPGGSVPGVEERPKPWGRREWAAWTGAVLFLLHPLNVEVLGHVSSRSDLLMGGLLLGALLLLCRALENPARRIGRAAWVGGQCCLAAALLTKEPAVLFPLAALPFLYLVQGEGIPPLKRLVRAGTLLAPSFFLVGGYLVLRKHLLGMAAAALPSWTGGSDPLTGGGRDMATQLFTQAAALGKALGLLFFPWKLSADHWIPFQHGLFSLPVLEGLGGLVLFTAGTLLLSRQKGTALAGLLWAGLLLSPTILVPLNQVFAEHRLYASGPGLALALGAALAGIRERAGERGWGSTFSVRKAAWAAGALALLLGGRSFLRSLDWRDRETLWRATLATDPRSFRAWAELGQTLGEKGDEEGALQAFREAHRLYPESAGIAVNLVEYLDRVGTRKKDLSLCEEALQVARVQVRRTPWKALPRVKLCRSLLALGLLRKDPSLAKEGVDAAASILSFTAPLDRTWAVWGAALDAAGEGEAARVLWKWGERVLPRVGLPARKSRADLLLRLDRPAEALQALGPFARSPDREVKELLRRIRLSGTSRAGSSGSPGASPPGR